MSTKRLFAIATLLLFASGPVRSAHLVYFAENGLSGQPRWLYNFDTSTGVSTPRALVGGVDRFFGLDARPSDGVVFAVTYSGPGGNSGLYTIDLNSGAFALVGLTGAAELVGIAFHPSTGELFALSNNERLYGVNPLTGVATFIGGTPAVARGLAFSPAGVMYGFSEQGALFTVNILTGNTTAIGGTGNMVADIHEDAAFTAEGELYAVDFSGRIFRTDPATGNGLLIGDLIPGGQGVLGLVAVPEPSDLMLAGLAAVAALWFWKRPGK